MLLGWKSWVATFKSLYEYNLGCISTFALSRTNHQQQQQNVSGHFLPLECNTLNFNLGLCIIIMDNVWNLASSLGFLSSLIWCEDLQTFLGG